MTCFVHKNARMPVCALVARYITMTIICCASIQFRAGFSIRRLRIRVVQRRCWTLVLGRGFEEQARENATVLFPVTS